MEWLLLALLAHALNALVFVVDKGLLGRRDVAVGQPAWYAVYSGLIAAVAGGLLVIDYAPINVWVALWSLGAGALWLLALWLFFIALKHGEASRVIPIAGSSVPVWTLLFATIFLEEYLSFPQLVAVGFLLVGGTLLSIEADWRRRVDMRNLLLAVGSGAAFAGHFAIAKIVYNSSMVFVPAFAYIRVAVGVWALLLCASLLGWRRLAGRRQPVRVRRALPGIALAFLASKIIGTVALLLQNYAIKVGSLTVVNAVQGAQYVVVLLLAVGISAWAPRFFREEMGRVTLGRKVAGSVCIGVRLGVLVL